MENHTNNYIPNSSTLQHPHSISAVHNTHNPTNPNLHNNIDIESHEVHKNESLSSQNALIDPIIMNKLPNTQIDQAPREVIEKSILIQKKKNPVPQEDRSLEALDSDQQFEQYGPSIASLDGLLGPSDTAAATGRQNSQEHIVRSLDDIESQNISQQLGAGVEVNNNGNNLNDQGQSELERLFRTEKIIFNNYKSKIRRILVAFAAIFLGSFFIPQVTLEEESSHRTLFIVIYIGLGYYFLEMFSRVFSPHIHRWQMVDDFFKAFDVLSLIVFFVLLDLHFTTGFDITKVAVVPHLAFATLYHFSTSAPSTVREPQTAFRIFYGIQLILITLKLDGDIAWSWKIVLCLVWFYCGMLVFYFSVLFVVMAMIVALAFLKKKVYTGMEMSTQFFGHIWHLIYVGFGVVGFITLVLTTLALEDELKVSILRTSIYVGRYIAIFMVVYTLVFTNTVILFLRRINHDDELIVEELIPVNEEKRLAKVEVESKVSHFVRISSTYFLPLKDSFVMRDKGYLRQLKKSVKESKDYLRKQSAEKKKVTQCVPVTLEELKRDQEDLEKKFQNLGRQSTGKKLKCDGEISLDIGKMYAHANQREVTNGDFSMVVRNGRAVCLSEGDQENFQEAEMVEMEGENDGNTCYICVQNPCNAVIMNCGHGGVCYDCALEFVKKKNQCMQCRRDVDRVVKINPDPTMKNIIKGYEAVKLVFA